MITTNIPPQGHENTSNLRRYARKKPPHLFDRFFRFRLLDKIRLRITKLQQRGQL